MTIYASKIEAVRIAHETTFGADLTGTLGSFAYVPFREGTLSLELSEPLESPMHSQQRVDGHPTRVHLPRTAKAVFECNVDTFTTKAVDTVAATKSWLGTLLETAMGGSHLMTGTTVNDAGADQDDWDGTVVTTLRPGAAVALPTGTGGTLELREIKSKSSSNIVLKHFTTNAPSNGATVRGTATYFTSSRTTGAEFKSLQLIAEGYTTTDKYVLLGGAVTALEMTLEPGKIPTMKVTVEFVNWEYADGAGVTVDLNGTVLGAATYTDAVTLVQADSLLCAATVGTPNSVVSLHASKIEFKPAMSFVKVRTPSGVNTVAQFVRTHAAPVLSGSFTLPYENQTWWDIRDADTIKALWYQIGSSPSVGACMISAPNVQIVDVKRVDVDGISCQQVDWVARLDSATTAESSYEGLAESAFRIHFA
jgi:hypothetical protein